MATDETTIPGSESAEDVNAAERRINPRLPVDASAALLLTNSGISIPGRILNLGRGGCRFHTDKHVPMSIYTRVEAEFYLRGLSFRVAGVTQSIYDRNTYGVRFLDMSERRREQLFELIEELAALAKAATK